MADQTPLFKPVKIGPKTASNRIAFNAMECNDADKEGNPQELTYRRYSRCMEGNAGVIFVEAISVLEDSRGRLNQLTHSGELSDPRFSRREMGKLAEKHTLGCRVIPWC